MALNTNAQKWVEALRSGEYTQTRGQLKDYSRFCCLGVACDLFMKETGRGYWNGDIFYAEDGGEYEASLLMPPIMHWLGLEDRSGGYVSNSAPRSLASQNDDGKSFSEIADIIEAEPEGLFS